MFREYEYIMPISMLKQTSNDLKNIQDLYSFADNTALQPNMNWNMLQKEFEREVSEVS